MDSLRRRRGHLPVAETPNSLLTLETIFLDDEMGVVHLEPLGVTGSRNSVPL